MTPTFRHAGAGCAVLTPTLAPGLRAAVERALRRSCERFAVALRVARRRLASPPQLDAATLRDLGLSHGAALAWRDDPVERRRPQAPHR